MGYRLKEALKTLCANNQWSYAVFWKIACQNPKLLIWEECYYEPSPSSALPHISGIHNPEIGFEDWEACWISAEARTSKPGVQAEDKVNLLINKMMMDNLINVVGEGLAGRAAFTGNHQWIHSENYFTEVHPPEVLKELGQQFSAGMQTVAIIPVLKHGIVQLGSSFAIMENMGFVHGVKTLILQLGCVPGALSSDNYTAKEPSPNIGFPFHPGKSVSTDLSGNYKMTNRIPFVADSFNQQSISSQALELVGHPSQSLTGRMQDNWQTAASTFQMSDLAQKLVKSHGDLCQSKIIPVMKPGLPFRNQLENRVTGAEVIPSNPAVLLNQRASLCIQEPGFDQQPCELGPSSANYSSLRLKEEHILSSGGAQEHANDSFSAFSGFMTPCLGTNGGLISSSQNDSVTNTSPEKSRLQIGVTSHPRSILNPCSLPNADTAANTNISCTHLAGSGLQNACSSETMVPTDQMDSSTTNHLLSGSSDGRQNATDDMCTQIELAQRKGKIDSDLFQAPSIPLAHLVEHRESSEHIPGFLHDIQKHDYDTWSPRHKNANYDDASVKSPSGNDLFDVLGVDFRNKLFNDGQKKLLNIGQESDKLFLGKNNFTSTELQDAGSDLYSVKGGNSVNAPSYGQVTVSVQMQGELFGHPKSLAKAETVGPCSFRSECAKEDVGKHSQMSSNYGSQISSWVDQGDNMGLNSSVSTGYSKRSDEVGKSNRKRLKPGENPRPRPKDRQMIQDRVKELREIVPNGAKCSIDALLERTIKHMLFLQSVTKHADKLKHVGESKIIDRENRLVLKDNFEGGATWAYEVSSQSMACPIIVEDLNLPRQMLVELLCEEQSLFLEIADVVRGLGLTILKGVMQIQNGKMWAHFVVEADRDVTRMEIFLSLVRVLEQTVKSCSGSVNGIGNDNMIVHQSLHQATSILATGKACSLR
ncbi:transcription factor LHW-like isoform X2 [Cornus florida]|uniref:transcription factor LHW-like isoform X2 n=1 Tax=Cornus florida TaxID=4283 RepID=UPI00289D13F2|nr:transcription factor LHW-like isoform X2 [Cornus florida]